LLQVQADEYFSTAQFLSPNEWGAFSQKQTLSILNK
jgi:hypothetical protein